jgi:hypothetical protein
MGDGGGDGGGEVNPPGRRLAVLAVFYLCAFLSLSFVGGSPAPDDLRTAHPRSVEEMGVTTFLCIL